MLEVSHAASTLLSALEKMGQSAGSGLVSSGPQGMPAEDLVKAFQQAMEQPEIPQSDAAQLQQTSDVAGMPDAGCQIPDGPEHAVLPGPAEFMPPVQEAGQSPMLDNAAHAPQSASAIDQQAPHDASQQDWMQEVTSFLERISTPGATVSPEELYRVQHAVGMLKLGAQSGQQASQQSTQGLESILRQSG